MKLPAPYPSIYLALLCGVFVFLPTPAKAAFDYWLNTERSSLNFLSTKNSAVTETHQFGTVNGRIQTNEGLAQLAISLASVKTGIAIRDERMGKHLFEIGDYPVAMVTLPITARFIDALKIGQLTHLDAQAELSLHGQKQTLRTRLNVVKLQNDSLLVTSTTPIVLNATDFGLSQGIQTLQSLAKLTSISTAIPVTFNLLFEIDTVSR